MTITLQHFDTKLKQDLEVQEQINNSLAEYLFPETELALGMIYKDATTAADLEEYQGKTLQFASGERLYFASQSVRDLLYPNPSDGAAYGSLVFTPNISFSEKKQLRILIIDDATGANGGLMPPDVAKKLVGDCYGKISSQLASELTGSSSIPFQFRIGIKPQAGNDVYRIAKGTLAPASLDNLSQLYFRNGREQSSQRPPLHGYDLILATSSFKGRKGSDAIKPGEYNLTLGIGVKALAAYGEHSLGTQVLVNYPRGVQADILSTLKEQAVNLTKIQSNPRAIAQLYIENYERRQQSTESFTEQLEVDSELPGLNTVISESEGDEEINIPEQKKQDMLLYRLLKADLTGHAQLLEHPKVIDGLNKFVRKEWVTMNPDKLDSLHLH